MKTRTDRKKKVSTKLPSIGKSLGVKKTQRPSRRARVDSSRLSAESVRRPEPKSGRVAQISRGLAQAFGSARGASQSPLRTARNQEETVRVGTYNVAAGNDEHSDRAHFDKTRRLIADEVVNGGADVINLQEVGVNGGNTRGRDNNKEIYIA